ncbi:hypothetical protein C8Q75DRAFT_136284 [Abortiporus biennis]|nr:hypothetical protein C8Q75DRAFT_136284 [Abortiporus biennis]
MGYTVINQALQNNKWNAFAEEIIPKDILKDVYVDSKGRSPRWSFLVCIEQIAVQNKLPIPVQDADDDEARDIVGQMEREFKDYTSAVRDGQVPSKSAKSHEYRLNQDSNTALLDGRYTENGPNTNVAPPIELCHEAFANFSTRSRDTNLEVPDEVLRDTAELIRKLSVITSDETQRGNACKQILQDILDTHLERNLNRDRTAADYWSAQDTPMNIQAPAVVMEFKSEIANNTDASVQGSFSFAGIVCQKDRERLRLASCCLTFLVGLAGLWIVICGAVMLTRAIVQRLSAYEWFGCSRAMDNEQVLRLGRMLYALRLGIAELKGYYNTLTEPAVIPGHIRPRYCPHITSFVDSSGQNVNFSYVKPLEKDSTCVTFQAKLLDGKDKGKLVVVKFVNQYCADAHRCLAEIGLAPQLIYDGTPESKPRWGGCSLVVMEFVDGKTLRSIYGAQELPDDLVAIKRGLDELKANKFIFGDLRRPNLMLADGQESVEERLRFIDFDWACREGDGVRYPFHLSYGVKNLSGARDYDIIERKHQDAMFQYLMN